MYGIYKQDLVLNCTLGLICYKTPRNKTKFDNSILDRWSKYKRNLPNHLRRYTFPLTYSSQKFSGRRLLTGHNYTKMHTTYTIGIGGGGASDADTRTDTHIYPWPRPECIFTTFLTNMSGTLCQ